MTRTNQTTSTSSSTVQPPQILTVQQVADLLQIPKSSVYEKTRRRPNTTSPLPCRRVGKYLRFFEGEVLDWLTNLPRRAA